MLGDREHAYAICEEYRAASGVDRDNDAEDRRQRRRITCSVLALWSVRGPLSSWYAGLGGPLAIWRDLAEHVEGGPVEGGHFFPEEHPDQTATALVGFFNGVESIHWSAESAPRSRFPRSRDPQTVASRNADRSSKSGA
jgi:haloacetate dehalogenase